METSDSQGHSFDYVILSPRKVVTRLTLIPVGHIMSHSLWLKTNESWIMTWWNRFLPLWFCSRLDIHSWNFLWKKLFQFHLDYFSWIIFPVILNQVSFFSLCSVSSPKAYVPAVCLIWIFLHSASFKSIQNLFFF